MKARPHFSADTPVRASRYEEILLGSAGATGSFTTRLADASRIARERAAGRGVSPGLADVAAGVAAPLLIGFALWVAATATERGVTRLHYVSRDGEAMLAVARRVMARTSPALECRYLYGSRQVWMLAGLTLSDEVLEEWTGGVSDITVRGMARRVGLSPNELWRLSGQPFTAPSAVDRPLSVAERRYLARDMLDGPLAEAVRDASEHAAGLAADYLAQQGFREPDRAALVDAGWSGQSARAFDLLVARIGGGPVEHYLVGLLDTVAKVRRSAQVPAVMGWLFDDDQRPGSRRIDHGVNLLVEVLCAGTEGRLLAYRREGDDVVPQFEQPRNTAVLAWGLAQVREVVQDVVTAVEADLSADSTSVELADPVWQLLAEFWLRPTRAEVAAWGTFPWEEELAVGAPYTPIAQTIRTREVVSRLRRGEAGVRRHTTWRAGSALASPQPWRGLLHLRARQHDRRSTRDG